MNRLWALLFLSIPVAAIGLYVASAWNVNPLQGTWMPQSMSHHADDVDHLFLSINLVAAVTLGITGLILFIALFRSGGNQAAKFVSGNTPLEILWTVVPAIILIVLALYQSGTWTSNKMTPPVDQTATAGVIARQFDWEFYYPGPDGELGTSDDLRSVNHLVVPKQEHVLLNLQSQDVIHSFSVPKLRLKQDIVPGTRHQVWFSPTMTGELEIICAEFCGWGHYNMRAKMSIVSQSEFETWLDALSRSNQEITEKLQ